KHAITGLTRSTALDGRRFGIACGQIDIGNAATDLTEGMARGALQADGSMRPEPRMDVADVARAVRYMAELPPDANVATMTLMATTVPYRGGGCSGPDRHSAVERGDRRHHPFLRHRVGGPQGLREQADPQLLEHPPDLHHPGLVAALRRQPGEQIPVG